MGDADSCTNDTTHDYTVIVSKNLVTLSIAMTVLVGMSVTFEVIAGRLEKVWCAACACVWCMWVCDVCGRVYMCIYLYVYRVCVLLMAYIVSQEAGALVSYYQQII